LPLSFPPVRIITFNVPYFYKKNHPLRKRWVDNLTKADDIVINVFASVSAIHFNKVQDGNSSLLMIGSIFLYLFFHRVVVLVAPTLFFVLVLINDMLRLFYVLFLFFLFLVTHIIDDIHDYYHLLSS